MPPVPLERVRIAMQFGLSNVPDAAVACRGAQLPFYAACALLEMESNGRNVYGHDRGGTFAGYPGLVDESNFDVFHWLIFDEGQTSNGVGPCQITYKGFFTQMLAEGLHPWIARENMFFGFRHLEQAYLKYGSWEQAGRVYNGSTQYGVDLALKVKEWRKRFGIRSPA